jgi:two-component system chemotaxis response regulator CheY
MTILTVDDAPTMRKLINLTLSASGYKVLEAADGPSALYVLRNSAVDLIVSDVNMPGMNGIELTREIRKLPRWASTPILIVTTESDTGIKAKAKSAGATGWIVKPFDPSQLTAIVKRVLGN